jgi:vacuolar-type H+-ATPase subunit H
MFLAAGCGGDGGNGGLTAEEFRQQADAICAEFEDKLDAVEQPSSPEDIERFVDEAVPIIEEGTQRLSELDPPEEFRDEWTRVVEINAENLEVIKKVQAALQDGNVGESQRLLQEAGGNEEEADRLAREIGLTKCGQDTA